MTDSKEKIDSPEIQELLDAFPAGVLLFEDTGDGLSDADRYRCIALNAAAAALTSHAQWIGCRWSAMQSEPMPRSNETTEVYFEKSEKWCQISARPMGPQRYLCTITDISDQKRLKEKEKQLEAILANAEATMKFGSWTDHTQDEQTRSDWWSTGLYDLLGYSSENGAYPVASGELYFEHVHPDDRMKLRQAVNESFENERLFEAEYRIKTVTGEEKHIISRGMFAQSSSTGRKTSYGNAFDLTPIKLIRSELEHKVAELNRSNLDLEQFAYVASHDLQEPLRKIVSFGERLSTKTQDVLSEEAALYLSRIVSASRRMQEMIANLLEFSRLTRSREGFVATDLGAIFRGVISDLELPIQQKKAHITAEILPVIDAIPTQMAQLFQNLFTNSLKFTRPDVSPQITVEAHELLADEQLNYGLPAGRRYLRILFSDNGIGFANEDAARIFTLFQRLRGRSEFEGAGIGLAVCKKVVENHSGIIMASARTDQGALFTIILPFKN